MRSAIVWFRRDLRLDDNPALLEAIEHYDVVIPLYIDSMPRASKGKWGEGSATRWWLHHSLASLDETLRSLGSSLVIKQGEAAKVLQEVIDDSGAEAVFWNRRYTPDGIALDSILKKSLSEGGLTVRTFNSALIKEPWSHLKGDGHPYRVFTPFWKAYLGDLTAVVAESSPIHIGSSPHGVKGQDLSTLQLLPRIPWDQGFHGVWQPGERGARRQLDQFLGDGVMDYANGRDIPAVPGTSRLSPHLHFGEISPRRIVTETLIQHGLGAKGPDIFLKEVGWREFAYHLLYHFPTTVSEPMDQRFTRFPWREVDGDALSAWQRGQTGYPIIDAGMRELWQTGWMHNRVRMIVASFLTKNLMIHWIHGAEWFWDTLVDADLASNTMGWQWTAGSGADAAPYFRIFNPLLQGEKFDPSGAYVRRWVPELSRLPDRWIHRPFEMSIKDLDAVGLRLGVDYPQPLVDLKVTRDRALAAFATLKVETTDTAD